MTYEIITALSALATMLRGYDLSALADRAANAVNSYTIEEIFFDDSMYGTIYPAVNTPERRRRFFDVLFTELQGFGFVGDATRSRANDMIPIIVESLLHGTPPGETYIGGAFLDAERVAGE